MDVAMIDGCEFSVRFNSEFGPSDMILDNGIPRVASILSMKDLEVLGNASAHDDIMPIRCTPWPSYIQYCQMINHISGLDNQPGKNRAVRKAWLVECVENGLQMVPLKHLAVREAAGIVKYRTQPHCKINKSGFLSSGRPHVSHLRPVRATQYTCL